MNKIWKLPKFWRIVFFGGAKVSFSAFQDLGHHFSVEVWDNVIEFAEIALDRALDSNDERK